MSGSMALWHSGSVLISMVPIAIEGCKDAWSLAFGDIWVYESYPATWKMPIWKACAPTKSHVDLWTQAGAGDYVCVHCLTEAGVCVDFHSPYHHQRAQKCPSFGLSSVTKVSSGCMLLEAISGSMAPPQSGSVSMPLILATTKGRTDAQRLV